MRKARSEDPPKYCAAPQDDQSTIDLALSILAARVKRQLICSPKDLRDYLAVRLSGERAECFGIVLLNSQHAILDLQILATGTIDSCPVSVREVARTAILADAAAVVVFHNHPSGNAEPSSADINLTRLLQDGLNTLGIRLIDHIIAGGGSSVSLAERGLI